MLCLCQAQDFLNAHLEWRTKFNPGALAVTDVEVAFRAGHGRFMGHGKNGEPIMWFRAGRWNCNEYDAAMAGRYTEFCMHHAEAQIRDITHLEP